MAKSKKVLGLDLGTTTSCVSIYEGTDVKVIPNSEGRMTTPSIVAFDKSGEIKVGDPAKRQASVNPINTVYTIKRLMGRSYDEVKDLKFSYQVVNNNGKPAVKIGDKIYSPEEISAMIIQKMKKTAEDYLGEEVERAVITVPAWFNDSQRSATKIAGEIAGLKVERIINEPTAASLSYGLDKREKSEKIMVFDTGGGTHDVSIIEFGDGIFEVLSTEGDVNLGGELFDEEVINWVCDEFKKENGVDLKKDPMALQRIKEAAEKAKIELSSSMATEINLPYITSVDGVPQHLVKSISRAKFENLIGKFVEKAINCAKSALSKAKLKNSDIDEIILVGGSTRIPYIQSEIEKHFNIKPNKSVNPDEAVSIGATIQGGIISGDVTDVLLLDVIPISIGIETMGGVFTKLIESNTTIPTRKSEVFSTASDNQPSVEIHILQGERPMAKDNKSLGRFHLDGILPSPRGIPQIECSIDVDANGILTVTAKDKGTGKENKIRIEGGSQLTKEEIERMKREAQENAETDRLEKEKIDKINQADSLIFQTEKNLKEFSDKLSEEDIKLINDSLSEVKEAHKLRDTKKIDDSINKLNESWGKVSSKLYSQEQPNNQSQEEVVDATFEEVK